MREFLGLIRLATVIAAANIFTGIGGAFTNVGGILGTYFDVLAARQNEKWGVKKAQGDRLVTTVQELVGDREVN